MKVIDTPLFWAMVVLTMVVGFYVYQTPGATGEIFMFLKNLEFRLDTFVRGL